VTSIVHDLRAILGQRSERSGHIDRQEDRASSLLTVLEEVQSRYRYLPRDALILISERLDIPLSQVYSVATFYNSFSLKPKGRHMFQVCTGTACHVRGAMQVLDRLETQLDIQAGQTSPDLEYTLEVVNCLGACALGPIVVADGEYEGLMTASKVDLLLKRMKREMGDVSRSV
jgi:NADH-quinone oxidoreductase subunit E